MRSCSPPAWRSSSVVTNLPMRASWSPYAGSDSSTRRGESTLEGGLELMRCLNRPRAGESVVGRLAGRALAVRLDVLVDLFREASAPRHARVAGSGVGVSSVIVSPPRSIDWMPTARAAGEVLPRSPRPQACHQQGAAREARMTSGLARRAAFGGPCARAGFPGCDRRGGVACGGGIPGLPRRQRTTPGAVAAIPRTSYPQDFHLVGGRGGIRTPDRELRRLLRRIRRFPTSRKRRQLQQPGLR